jgi:ribose transport system ATP-binding protein
MPTEPLWELRDVSKAFPGVQALDGVTFRLHEGEIHALVGENGSGKSTLAKCISGVHAPDTGTILRQGVPMRIKDPQHARSLGVATFHQEFSLVPALSVAENICLGRLPGRGPLIDWAAARREAAEALARLEVAVDPTRLISSLSVAEQQFVEIAKAISQDMSLLILDEPSAALGPHEVERLHEVIRRIADQGPAILYISHRLDEVMEVVDRVTVIKDGEIVDSVEAEQTSVREVVRMMVGMDIEEHFPDRPSPSREIRVEVRGLRTANNVNGVGFEVRRGEVLGLGGIAGAGRTEIARALFGIDRWTDGEVRLDGAPVRLRSPADAIAAGIALVPENRKTDGLFFNFSAPPNISIADLARIRLGPLLALGRERRRTKELVDKLSIAGRAMEGSVQNLSGGNQQKVVLARWLFAKVRFLILDEPTQGVDVSAKVEVYRLINELSAAGLAILLISSDYPELLAMSDRVAVIRRGEVVEMANRGDLTEHELVELAAGGVMTS